MPNALTHLYSTSTLLDSGDLCDRHPFLADSAPRAAFLLGAISPDVRILSGQPREETHFFEIPPVDARSAPGVMLARWPEIASRKLKAQERRAFVAGYITHLVMDRVWVDEIVMGHLFVGGEKWGTGHPSWWLYSLLMTYMEYHAVDRVPADTVERVRSAHPRNQWLPFVADKYLIEWRDRVTNLIKKGGARMASWMFAQSNNIEPDELEAIILSPQRLQEEAFSRVPQAEIAAFLDTATQRSKDAVLEYLQAT